MDFETACREAKKHAFSMNNPLIVHHYDADGISSGSVVISAFRKEFKNHRHKWIKKLDDAEIEKLEKEKEIIFVDLGGGNKRINELKDVLVIDHHQTEGIDKFQINPLLFGIDGGTELSASGTAYSVFKTGVDLAVVGAVGDMQYPLTGKNREIMKEGVEKREIEVLEDLRLYGRSSRPLAQFLSFSDEVYIPGITYKEENAYKLLEDLGIKAKKETGEFRTYIDLSEGEKTKLKRKLVEHLAVSSPKSAKNIIGEVYILKKRPVKSDLYDASEFSTILNACGRHGKADTGVGVCLGSQEAYKEALQLLIHHKKMIREGVEYAKNNLQDFGVFYFVNATGIIDEGIIGIVCGMILGFNSEKPIIGVSSSQKGWLKISSRGTQMLVSKGLNLGRAMKNAGKKTGGVGGGHKIAAGASIPSEKLDGFLLEIKGNLRQKSE
ncbi:DHH family phosphoesterase [Candidatus Micrarchaeota archaeon]|nr:DHH family phosphoesterase [Candidatus Micrarchaeota archaeon]